MARGLLIVFAGQNGSGKTSLINGITEKLNNSNIVIKNRDEDSEIKLWNVFKFPNRNTILGKKIDDFLKNKIKLSKEIELKFFAANRKEFQFEIINLLKNGYNVICDRYVYCSMAYTLTNQTIDIKNNINVNILSMNCILEYDCDLIKPDYTFLIRGDFLALRNEIAERYHNDGLFNDLLLNNYILSLACTNSNFTIIENKLGKLNEAIDTIINKLNYITKKKINIIQKF